MVGKETKSVTVMLASAAVFAFDAWNPPFTLWEVKPVKSEYNVDEGVYVMYCVKNIGDAKGRWTVTVKDLDTGVTVKTFWGDLDPGYRFKTSGSHAFIGKMPARNWRLEFTVTP